MVRNFGEKKITKNIIGVGIPNMSQHKTDKLVVKYQVFGEHDVNGFLDSKIEKIANESGLEFIGSGYDFSTQTRDLEFEAPSTNL